MAGPITGSVTPRLGIRAGPAGLPNLLWRQRRQRRTAQQVATDHRKFSLTPKRPLLQFDPADLQGTINLQELDPDGEPSSSQTASSSLLGAQLSVMDELAGDFSIVPPESTGDIGSPLSIVPPVYILPPASEGAAVPSLDLTLQGLAALPSAIPLPTAIPLPPGPPPVQPGLPGVPTRPYEMTPTEELKRKLDFALTQFVHSHTDSSQRRARNQYLLGNFAPVQETVHAQNLPIEGTMPKCLEGVFVRVGPNPRFTPAGDYHWFDGDGMLHACRIKDGQVSYCNRFVDTFRLAQEEAFGGPVYVKLGDLRGMAGMAHISLAEMRARMGLAPDAHGFGAANTSLCFHAKRLLALQEGDLPYAARIVCDGVIESLGRVEFQGKVKHPFTAHPKIDAETGELFFIGYTMVGPNPQLWYGGLDAEANPVFDYKIKIKHGVMHHDFAVTQDHALIIEHCLEFNAAAMVMQNRVPFTTNKDRNCRIGVLPKRPHLTQDKQCPVRWFELDQPLVILHTINAWQEGDTLRLFTCFFDKLDFEGVDSVPPQLGEIQLNLKTGKAVLHRMQADVQGDFPKIREDLLGKPNRYAYVSTVANASMAPRFTGVAKIDLTRPHEDCCVGRLFHGPTHGGGEAFFVPRHKDPSLCDGEDDGFLVTFVHDESATEGGSAMVVYDAKTMSSTPIARVPLPQRVPYGFHCLHLSEQEFQSQLEVSEADKANLAKPDILSRQAKGKHAKAPKPR